MIIGTIDVTEGAVLTHRDSFFLANISVVSVRKPYLAGSVLLSASALGFVSTFADLLYPNELFVVGGAVATVLLVGFQTAQLTLLSRDLKGSELASAIWGTSGDLQRARQRIVRERQRLLETDETFRAPGKHHV